MPVIQEGDKDVKAVLSELSELRYLVATDKPMQDLVDNGESVNIWNAELSEMRLKVSWNFQVFKCSKFHFSVLFLVFD